MEHCWAIWCNWIIAFQSHQRICMHFQYDVINTSKWKLLFALCDANVLHGKCVEWNQIDKLILNNDMVFRRISNLKPRNIANVSQFTWWLSIYEQSTINNQTICHLKKDPLTIFGTNSLPANSHSKLKRKTIIKISEELNRNSVYLLMLIDKHFSVLNKFPLKSIFRVNCFPLWSCLFYISIIHWE